MKRRIGMLVGALILSAFVSGARADEAAVRKALDAQYAKFNTSLVKKDMKTMFDVLTPDATYVMKGMVQNREQMRQMMTQTMAMMQISKASNKIEKLTMKGEMAIVVAAAKSSGKMKGTDGKIHPISYTSKTRDHWTKTPGGWKIKKIEAISESMTVDGKPFTQTGG
jgi:ketosteroid isomerase-like protein